MSHDELNERRDDELLSEFARTRANRFLDELVRRYYKRVLAGAKGLVRNKSDAADIAQETFVRVVKHAGQFAGGNFHAWLFTITKRLAVDYARKSTVLPMPGFSTCSDKDELALRAAVEQVLRRLSRPQQICLQYFYQVGLTYREISRRTGYSEKAVKAHIQNGRNRFKRLWDQGPEGGSE